MAESWVFRSVAPRVGVLAAQLVEAMAESWVLRSVAPRVGALVASSAKRQVFYLAEISVHLTVPQMVQSWAGYLAERTAGISAAKPVVLKVPQWDGNSVWTMVDC
jgi:hypothetical protein